MEKLVKDLTTDNRALPYAFFRGFIHLVDIIQRYILHPERSAGFPEVDGDQEAHPFDKGAGATKGQYRARLEMEHQDEAGLLSCEGTGGHVGIYERSRGYDVSVLLAALIYVLTRTKRIRRIMNAYTDDRIFSLDLVGAVGCPSMSTEP